MIINCRVVATSKSDIGEILTLELSKNKWFRLPTGDLGQYMWLRRCRFNKGNELIAEVGCEGIDENNQLIKPQLINVKSFKREKVFINKAKHP